MLPSTGTSSPELRRIKSPDTSSDRKHRLYLLLAFFSLQILLLLYFHRPQPHFPSISTLQIDITEIDKEDDTCEHGKVFVYNLPSQFNTKLLDNCHELNPWFNRCEPLSNRGFGPRADSLSLPNNLSDSWYRTDQFALEIIFHNRIINHKCVTKEAKSATAFYIPFYAGLAVGKYLWNNYTAQDRDRDCEMVLTWLKDQPYWYQSNGSDHFLTMGRISWDFRRSGDSGWGSGCLHKPLMSNITRLLMERNSWDYLDVGVPYPTGFHPKTPSDLLTWQEFARSRNRTTLFSFEKIVDNEFQGILLNHCNRSSNCRAIDCSGSNCDDGTSVILETYLDSDFCLQPKGDSFTHRSIFDCMIAGSIPVFFWKRTAYYQYEWFLPGDQDSYSVYIDHNEVTNGTSIRGVLEKFSREEVREMREKVIEYIPSVVYVEPNEGLEGVKDAFDVAIEGVLRRMKEQQGGYTW